MPGPKIINAGSGASLEIHPTRNDFPLQGKEGVIYSDQQKEVLYYWSIDDVDYLVLTIGELMEPWNVSVAPFGGHIIAAGAKYNGFLAGYKNEFNSFTEGSVAVGGWLNTASGGEVWESAFIAGTRNEFRAYSNNSVHVGGYLNRALGVVQGTVFIGGSLNEALNTGSDVNNCVFLGGYQNKMRGGQYSSVVYGNYNIVGTYGAHSNANFVGGVRNVLQAGFLNTIFGGGHLHTGNNCLIGGQACNDLDGAESVANSATDPRFIIGNGLINGGFGRISGSNAFVIFQNGAAQFFRATLASITNAAAGFFIFNSEDTNRPYIHNGTEWKGLAYKDEKIDPSQLPDLAITDVFTAAETSLLDFMANNAAYVFQQGDVVVIVDANGNKLHFIFKGGDKALAESYSQISASSIPVENVTGLIEKLAEKENTLGNPITDGEVLSSTAAGIRSWQKVNSSLIEEEFIIEAGGFLSVKRTLTIPDGTITTSPAAVGINTVDFSNQKITDLVLPDSVTRVYALLGGNWIKILVFSNFVQIVGPDTFPNSTELERITFGSGLTEIDPNAFSSCPKLELVTFNTGAGSTPIIISTGAFINCPLIASVDVPAGSTVEAGAFDAGVVINYI